MIYAQDQLTLKKHSAYGIAAMRKENILFDESNLSCPHCGGKVILKNGLINIPHFAHVQKDCGYFDYKGMSKWHLDWQSHFPQAQREVIKKCQKTGEKHIADTVNARGTVIEFQNSSISLKEKLSRDSFYNEIIWVVNAEEFKDRIKLAKVETPLFRDNKSTLEYLQSPFGPVSDYSINKVMQNTKEVIKAVNKQYNYLKDSDSDTLSISLCGVENFLNDYKDLSRTLKRNKNKLIEKYQNKIKQERYENYYLLEWAHPRKIWYDSKTPVFFDLNNGIMILWHNYKAHRITKTKFLEKYCTSQYAETH